MPRLTTHALDTTLGLPAAAMKVDLYRGHQLLASAILNADGRSDAPLLEGDPFTSGPYSLHFHVREYFLRHGIESPFLDIVPIHFSAEPGRSYHVPLVVSPFSYSTYRGS